MVDRAPHDLADFSRFETLSPQHVEKLLGLAQPGYRRDVLLSPAVHTGLPC